MYHGISFERLRGLTERESTLGVFALASVWPCCELLTHCGDADDTRNGRARAAVERLLLHAGRDAPDGRHLRMHLDGENTLGLGLFNYQPEHDLREYNQIATVIRDLVKQHWHGTTEAQAALLEHIVRMVADKETAFVSDMAAVARVEATHDNSRQQARAKVVAELDGPDGVFLVAKRKVQETAARLNIALGDNETSGLAAIAAAGYPVAMHFLKRMTRRAIAFPEINWVHQQNSYWDFHMSFHAGWGATTQRRPMGTSYGRPRTSCGCDGGALGCFSHAT
ncbi:MAG TPA: hypothetical protein VGM77_02100 [Gemmatimonadales bacterium]